MAFRKLYSSRKMILNCFKNPESQQVRHISVTPMKFEEAKAMATKVDIKPEWDRALSEAEKCIGPQSSYVSLRLLINDEVANWGEHIQRLEGSNHPMYDAAK
jgi:hypothetical protein